MPYSVADYVRDLRAIRNTGSATAETSFYPPVDKLFNAAGETLRPRVLFSTQLRNDGAGQPDGGFFPQPKRDPRASNNPPPLQLPERGAVEIKPAAHSLEELATSAQTLRYLERYKIVLITNLREFLLLDLRSGRPHPLERYKLATSADDLWHGTIDPKHNELLPDFLRRVMLYRIPLTEPRDVAWFLASYAREARARAEDHDLPFFRTVKLALEESLGIQFDGEKGEHFFRSTLVQTLFYGIFSAWILWRRAPGGRAVDPVFNWRLADDFLHVPILRKLFREVSDRHNLNSIQITEILDLAGEVLNRVQPSLFDTFREEEAVAYFYEPFLEAFDPALRKQLGVWYTPKEIVLYMVERVDHLLRTELNQPLGLASPNVRILDPCCGTGAYLTAVLHRIHTTLKEQAGDDSWQVPSKLRTAALTRVFGFEIMPAPFVIAHMEINRLLEEAQAPLTDDQRAGVFLTNALTGWVPVRHPQSVMYEEMAQEREAAEDVKQQGTILVILGNPPYNGYAGIATIEEERDLTLAYRAPVAGLPAPQGQGLNDLYIRFFRIAERRIAANPDGQGIVSFISNYSWLDGLSYPTMRHHLLRTFSDIFIDNLHGDRKISEYAPDGRTSETVFAVTGKSVGIRVGTSVSTFLRRGPTSGPGNANYRDFDEARASDRREAMLESLNGNGFLYAPLSPSSTLGLPLKPRLFGSSYTSWPRLEDLFPRNYPGIKTSRDSLVVDIDREKLEERLRIYTDPEISLNRMEKLGVIQLESGARFDADATRRLLQRKGFDASQIRRFCYRPFDLRWLYWESTTKLLDEKREDYVEKFIVGNPTIVSAQHNRRIYDAPYYTTQLVNIHVNERSANAFPLMFQPGGLLGNLEPLPNIGHSTLEYLERREFRSDFLFFHAFAIMHTPGYRAENAGALLSDWPRIPLPANAELLQHSAALGRRLADLLDAESPLELTAEWSFLAALKLPRPDPQRPHEDFLREHLKLTAGWGSRGQGSTVMPGRGRTHERPWTPAELQKLAILEASQSLTHNVALGLLGETCLDIYLNRPFEGTPDIFWSAVPINVWNYTLGGYQVLKKWLSYRELPLLGRPLHDTEAAWFAQIVRRITAILLLGPALDASYAAILPTATGLPQ